MEFKDYYQALGVAKGATAAEIKQAYRKQARRFHPDVSKEADAEKRMAEINEAYAVLSDPERRSVYDTVGAQAWAQGARSAADMQPPPGWNAGAPHGKHTAQAGMDGREEDFSDFFAQMFGRGARTQAQGTGPLRGADRHASIELDLLDSFHGAEREITLRGMRVDASGHVVPDNKTLQIRIPKGVSAGQLIRLAGQGDPGFNGGAAGDLLLEVRFRTDPHWQVQGRDLFGSLRVTPWEAALGGQAALTAPDGTRIEVAVPAGSGTGRKLRLKGRGLPSGTAPGDLYLLLSVAVPGAVTPAQKAAWEALAQAYPGFDPRVA